jgi:hypothetical protein
VTVGGSVQIRSRNFTDMSFNKNSNSGNQIDTQERIMIDVNAKAGDNVKGKISLWNDWEDFGRQGALEKNMGKGFGSSGTTQDQFGFREAWMSFDLPDIPINVTVGHQLLKLGGGWFFLSNHYGSDAWVISNKTGNNTLGFINVKIAEGSRATANSDADAYVLFDVLKLNENMAVGLDLTDVRLRPAAGSGADLNEIQNIGLNFNGKMGTLNLKAEADFQMGKDKTTPGVDSKYKGMQAIVQGNLAMDPLTINFLLGYGTGDKENSNDNDGYVNYLDTDPHYTFMYEYLIGTACTGGGTVNPAGNKNKGMCNTTAIGAGVMFAASKSLKVGLDAYYLQATEKVMSAYEAGPLGNGGTTSDLGTEIDVKILWKLYDNLTWNWDIGYFMPGDAYKTASGADDAATAIQGVLAFKF